MRLTVNQEWAWFDSKAHSKNDQRQSFTVISITCEPNFDEFSSRSVG